MLTPLDNLFGSMLTPYLAIFFLVLVYLVVSTKR